MAQDSSLLAAWILAGIFGAALLWSTVCFVYRYVHGCCVQLDHWILLLTPLQWRRGSASHGHGHGCCGKEVGHGCGGKTRVKSRSRSRYGRWDDERVGYVRSGRRCHSLWDGTLCVDVRYVERPPPVLTMAVAVPVPVPVSVQRPMYEEQYYPLAGEQMTYPQTAYRQLPLQYTAPMAPATMPQHHGP